MIFGSILEIIVTFMRCNKDKRPDLESAIFETFFLFRQPFFCHLKVNNKFEQNILLCKEVKAI